jgi:hypothetical protein
MIKTKVVLIFVNGTQNALNSPDTVEQIENGFRTAGATVRLSAEDEKNPDKKMSTIVVIQNLANVLLVEAAQPAEVERRHFDVTGQPL